MAKKARRSWAGIALDAWLLGAEAGLVITLRLHRIARGGGAGRRETRLMVDEKVDACLDLGKALITGRLGRTPKDLIGNTVAHYLDGVRANRRRLTRGRQRASSVLGGKPDRPARVDAS